jgi:hypothetical protein
LYVRTKFFAHADGTTGNTLSQIQCEYNMTDMVQDKIFYSALLASAADISITVGGVEIFANWSSTPTKGIGIYHGSVAYGGHLGKPTFEISRNGKSIAGFTGAAISTDCGATGGIENWNAWVGYAQGVNITAVTSYPLDLQNCTSGTGVGLYGDICPLTCQWSYCPAVCTVCIEGETPPGNCSYFAHGMREWLNVVIIIFAGPLLTSILLQCNSMGIPLSPGPKATGVVGYPLAGLDGSYTGLCSKYPSRILATKRNISFITDRSIK